MPTVEVAAPSLKSVEAAVAEAAVHAYVSALVSGDRQAAIDVVDAGHFLELGLGGQAVPAAAWEQAQSQASVASAVVDEHLSLLKSGTTLRPLQSSDWTEGAWVTVGVIHRSGGLDQWKFRVADIGGTPKIVDIWSLSTGQSRSQDAARVFGLISGMDPDAEGILRVEEQIRLGNFKEAWQLTGSAPEPMRRRRDLMLMRVDAAQRLDMKKFTKAVDALMEHHADDPGARMRATLSAQANRDAAASIAHFEWLQERVGPDAYLYVITSAALSTTGDVERARAAADAAVELEPTLLEAWVQQALVAAAQGDEPVVERALIKLQTRFGVEPGMFADAASYEALRKTAAFKRWAGEEG